VTDHARRGIATPASCLRVGAAMLVCLLLGACVHPRVEPASLGAGAAPHGALPGEFTLLSWNTHKQRHSRFEAELLRFEIGVDVILLQEATQVRPVWELLPDQRTWTLVVAFEYGRGEIATGVATGSFAAPIREQALLSPVAEPLLKTPKSSLVSWIEIDGADQPVLLVNLHGINFRRAPALDAQLGALDELLEAHEGPAVVAGDFNTWSGRRRAALDNFAARHQLVSAFDGRPRPRLHDDVFVRGLVIVDAVVLRSRSSDHDALRVELRVP
jgi:endonuclease/exonuclease/phosphatase (EEP) superfamily protein YafD